MARSSAPDAGGPARATARRAWHLAGRRLPGAAAETAETAETAANADMREDETEVEVSEVIGRCHAT